MSSIRQWVLRRFVAGELRELSNRWVMDRKPLRIHDCYGVLENITWIWRISCIFPLTLQYPLGETKYAINKVYATFTFLVGGVCIVNFVHGLIYLNETIRNPVPIEVVTVLIRVGGSLICMILCGICRIIRHKELSGPIETMAVDDLVLEKMGCHLNYNSSGKIIRAYVWTVFLIVLLLMAYDLYASYLIDGEIHLMWTLYIIPLITQIMDLTIFVSLVALLGIKLRALNERIKAIVIRANSSPPKVIMNADVCAENLRAVAKAHYNICAVGKRINSYFDFEVIINVIVAFIILSTTLYYIFIEVQRDEETNWIRIGTFIQWEFVHSFPIIVMVATCNWTTRQTVHTGKLIHEIRVEKMDSPLYEALKTFSLQLHHQKLEFTAGGFFPLNSTLLQTVQYIIRIHNIMVGNITTYLVILIQFQPKLNNYPT